MRAVSRRLSVAHRPGAVGGRGGLPPAGLAAQHRAERGALILYRTIRQLQARGIMRNVNHEWSRVEVVIEAAEDDALLGLRDDLRAIGSSVNAEMALLSREAPEYRLPHGWVPKATMDPAMAVLVVGASLQAVRIVANVVSLWIQRQHARSITLSVGSDRLEIKSASGAHQAAVIEAWLENLPQGSSASPELEQAKDA